MRKNNIGTDDTSVQSTGLESTIAMIKENEEASIIDLTSDEMVNKTENFVNEMYLLPNSNETDNPTRIWSAENVIISLERNHTMSYILSTDRDKFTLYGLHVTYNAYVEIK